MFLQTGLGLTRSQWDSDFYAFDPGGSTLRRQNNLPWMDFNKGDWTFSSADLPTELWSAWQQIPGEQRDKHPGYVPGVDCYVWGYRPEDVEDPVLFGVRGVYGLGALPRPFKVCAFRVDQPCPACPPAPACPTPAPCPTCPSPTTAPVQAPVKYGVNIGLLVAGALTAGVGYYGYKKGWFKKLGKKK